MNDFVQKLIQKYQTFGWNKSLDVLYDVQDIIKEARADYKNGDDQKQFQQKFIIFLDSFCRSTKAISDVYFHVRKKNTIWNKLSNNSQINIPSTDQLNQLADFNDFFVVNESYSDLNLLIENQITGQKFTAVLFQLFGYCNYLVIFNKNDYRSQKALRLIETLVTQIKEINKEYLANSLNRRKIDQLEKELVSKERNLIVTERNLKRRVYEIHNLLEISNELYSILNLKQLINSALLIIVGQVGCQKAFAFLYDTNDRKYSRRFTKGLDMVELADLEIAVDHPLVGFFEKIQKPILLNDLRKNESLISLCDTLREHQIELIAPVIYNDRVQGFIGCGALLSDQEFSKNEMDIFNILINIISISVSNAQTYEEVKNLSLTDAMTSLNNYRYFEDRLKEEINRARRSDTPVSLLMLDIDYFKNYNDTLGHQAGDEALRNLGWILKNTVRDEDIVNRYGGEEFGIILPGIEKNVISVLGERIRSKIEEYPFYKENVQPGGRITVSLGGACFSCDADNFDDLVYKADQALYKAKNSGRNKLTIYNTDM